MSDLLEDPRLSDITKSCLSELKPYGFVAEMRGKRIRITNISFPFLGFVTLHPKVRDITKLREKASRVLSVRSGGRIVILPKEDDRPRAPRPAVRAILLADPDRSPLARMASRFGEAGSIRLDVAQSVLRAFLASPEGVMRTKDIREKIPSVVSDRCRTQEAFRSTVSSVLRAMSDEGVIRLSNGNPNAPSWVLCWHPDNQQTS